MRPDIEIRMGAMSDPINEQLSAQGYELDDTMKERAQKDADAITRLVLGELITDSIANKARDKLFKRIMKSVKEQL